MCTDVRNILLLACIIHSFLLQDQAHERTEWRRKLLLTHPLIDEVEYVHECVFKQRLKEPAIQAIIDRYPRHLNKRLDLRETYKGLPDILNDPNVKNLLKIYIPFYLQEV